MNKTNVKNSGVVKAIAIGVFLLLLGGYLFSQIIFSPKADLDRRIHEKLAVDGASIPFETVTGFDWDEVCVLSPYSTIDADTIEKIEAKFNIRINSSSVKMPHLDGDNSWLFIFVKNNSGFTSIENPKDHPFSYFGHEPCLSKVDAYLMRKGNAIELVNAGVQK